MKRYLIGVVAFWLVGMLASCGGGGGGGGDGGGGGVAGGGGSNGGGGGGSDAVGAAGGNRAGVGARVEESSPAVTLSGPWTPASSELGWSGGAAVQSSTAGATASVNFTGTSIRWLGSRGRRMGIALVSVDGGPAREVDLFARPADEAHSPVVTINDLSDGPHTLTIQVAGRGNSEAWANTVVVDAFEVQPGNTVSHLQDTDPNARYAGAWTKSVENGPWSGSGVSNVPELPVTAQETTAAGASVSLPFRGTGISWVGYVGPDGGIANVQIDGGAPTQVDTYSPSAKYQPVVFSASGLADTNHTLTITATGQKNPASSAARIVVDAWDVITPGRRFEETDPAVVYAGNWEMRDSRVWTEGRSIVSNTLNSTATFTFTGTSVSWIGCEKGSASGTVRVFIDGVVQREIYLGQDYPIEGYQMTVFRADGLSNGRHTLTIQVISNGGGYVVVDAFDVH